MRNWLESLLNKLFAQINTTDIILFLKQFSALIKAGIPLIKSLTLLEESQKKSTLRILIYSIKKEILSGKSLHESLNCYPQYFDRLVCQLILIGERTGQLDDILNTISLNQEKNQLFKQRLNQALFYPCIIMIIASLVVICLFLFVIPKFAELFQDFKQTLPLLTQIIFYISNLFQYYSKYLLFFLFIFFIIYLYHKNKIKKYLLFFIYSLPIIKSLLKKIELARFARMLAMTFKAGLPITEALLLSSRLTNNMEFIHIITHIRHQISSGVALHRVMNTFTYFPLLMIQMVKIGEETGDLDHMLNKMAEFIESDIDQIMHHIGKLLEPLIMMILGVLIGGLIIGIYLPIFKLGAIL